MRDAESRTRFLGWRAENVKLFAFTVSAVMAGIAGALYVPQVGIINPGEFEPANSIEVVIWTAVGGRGTIVGPIIGAVLVNTGKSWFTGALPEFWLFALGGLFVAVTLFLPKGIVGLWDQWRNSRSERAAQAAARSTAPDAAGRRSCGPRRSRTAGRLRTGRRTAAGGVRRHEPQTTPSSISTASRSPSTASAPSTICPSSSTRARCAPSSAPTAPARRR